MAGEVALEEPDGVSAGFAFGDASFDVVAGGGVVQSPVEDDGVQCSVELAVAAAAEPVRVVWPEEAGIGATPASRAKAASERTRPLCDQLTISWAATIGPTPGSSSSLGASARTWARISVCSSAASSVADWTRRARVRSTSVAASSSGVRLAGAAQQTAAVDQPRLR